MAILEWRGITVLLCTYGFVREIRPSEPFVSEFLTGHWRDLTPEQVFQQVYPVGTYSYLALLLLVFLITDMLRYKPLIIVSGISGVIVYAILLWTTSLEALQVSQFFYGLFMATEVAYYTYIYAKVDRQHFSVVTGFTKSATLAGRFMAGVTGQLLVSFRQMDLRQLNYITFGAQAVSLIWAILLPGVATSIYFYAPATTTEARGRAEIEHTEEQKQKASAPPMAEIDNGANLPTPPVNGVFSSKRAVRLLWKHFIDSYSDLEVVQWSLWWALTTCGFIQVQTYVQFLWQEIDPDRETIYNGAVEAALTLLGAGAAFGAGFIRSQRFDALSMWVLSLCSLFMGGVLMWGSLTAYVWSSYVAYVLFGTATHFMITIASINIAKRLQDDSFGLVFGLNTLAALAFQTILTVVVVSEHAFALGPREHFTVNSGYFLVLGVCFGLLAIGRLIWNRCRS